MGDSVAFGPAVKDDVKIAGNLRRAMPRTKIYNGAAGGYDSFDYRTVTSAVVEQHPEIKTVALFFCLNDVSDASAQLIRSEHGETHEIQIGSPSITRRINDYLRSRSKLYLWLKNLLVDTQMFYFKNDLASYQKGEQNVDGALHPIVEFDKALMTKGIALKVFISPYEAQLRSNTPAEYLRPQQMITTFLTQNDVDNYDLAPDFLKFAPDTNSLYLCGDPMRLSVSGAKVTADIACAKVANCTVQK
jgi:hypothetical protein